MYEKVHELVWIKLNESKCTVKQWNIKTIYVQHIIFIVNEATCFGPYRAIIRPVNAAYILWSQLCLQLVQSIIFHNRLNTNFINLIKLKIKYWLRVFRSVCRSIYGIATCTQRLLTRFVRRSDDGPVRAEICSLTHDKICVGRKWF